MKKAIVKCFLLYALCLRLTRTRVSVPQQKPAVANETTKSLLQFVKVTKEDKPVAGSLRSQQREDAKKGETNANNDVLYACVQFAVTFPVFFFFFLII